MEKDMNTEIIKQNEDYKCGLVALVGLPNAGKSTLLNALLGEKVVITSPKPQTTRNAIQGIKSTDKYQMIFVDTPGYHAGRGKLNKAMLNQTEETILSVDVICLLVDATERIGNNFLQLLEKVKSSGVPVILVITKLDNRSKEDLYKTAEKLAQMGDFLHIVPISSKTNKNLDTLEGLIAANLPKNQPIYDTEEVTNQPEKFLISEFIREQAFMLLKQEVPYDILVETEAVDDKENKMHITASIIVSRDSQKGIVIGKGGEMLKEIGTRARKDLELFFGVKIYLELFVKTREGWNEQDDYLKVQLL